MKQIEHWLRQEIGLDTSSVGTTSIERIIRLRMKQLGVKRPEEYLQLLKSDLAEREELVETVVVTETWFFRDREPFAVFAQMARDWLQRSLVANLRILSLPCSSGEEPYSLAMALLDADFPPQRFAIDGVDISSRALAKAQRAVFGNNSFRGKGLDFRSRHFHATEEGYLLHPRVRDCVRFHRANLLEADSLGGSGPYDFIFCRNLLIYFDRDTQAKALDKLHRLLSPHGVLFVGAAELPLATRNGFVSANISLAFACSKAGAQAAPTPVHRRRTVRTPRPAPASAPTWSAPPAAACALQPRQPAAISPPEPPRARDLAEARRLADAGELDTAAVICRSLIERDGPSAQVYYLLGLVYDAGGDPRAEECYRKALYLDPNHYETLLQMALLRKKNGDAAGARALKRRAERLQSSVLVNP